MLPASYLLTGPSARVDPQAVVCPASHTTPHRVG